MNQFNKPTPGRPQYPQNSPNSAKPDDRPPRPEKSAPGPRWKFLYSFWDAWLAQPEPPQFDRWLAAQFKGKSKFGRKDRAWYSNHLFAALRYGFDALVLHEMQHTVEPAGLQAQLRNQYPDFEAVRAAWRALGSGTFFRLLAAGHYELDIDRRAGADLPMTEIEQAWTALRAAAKHEDFPAPLAWMLSGVPPWFVPAMERRMAAQNWSAEKRRDWLKAITRRAPLWLRVHRAEDFTTVKRELDEAGLLLLGETDAALAIDGERSVYELPSWKAGQFTIQDYASQLAGAGVEAHPGQFVWDCCAGGGGKALQLAAMLENRGGVYASDVRAFKLDDLRKRARTAGFHNIRTIAWDGETMPEFGREIEIRGGFDAVLVDAPCSSAGVWRRNPDAKWRTSPATWNDLPALQHQILSRAARAVRPGGRLVYLTCSWLMEENEDVVAKFLADNPGFTLASQGLIGSPDHDSDTFFQAIMALNSEKTS